MEQTKGNLRIDGMFTSEGGEYEKIVINGQGTVTSNVQADCIRVNGIGTFQGNVNSDTVIISGMATIKEGIVAEELKVSGSATIEGGIEAEKLIIEGMATIQGNVESEEVRIEGKASIHGDCEAETFKMEGQIKIKGQLNAESIHICSVLKSEIHEITGSSIQIVRDNNLVTGMVNKALDIVFTNNLAVNTIEGDQIELDHVTARVVRGEDVTIGENCEIDLIEYSGTLKQHPRAKIKEARKM